MKKLYTLALSLFLSVAAFAQGSEDFTNATLTATYADGSFVGNGGLTWTYGHSRNVDTYGIDGNGIMLRRALDSYLEVTVPSGGIGTLTFDYKKAFTGNSQRQLEVIINGTSVGTSATFGDVPTGADPTVHNFSLSNINVEGAFTMRIKNVGDGDFNRQTVIDNIVWTAYTLGVKENNIAGLKVYPNPVTGGKFFISTDANTTKSVAIFDVLGKQVVNTTATETVNVSNLKAGVYIVKITEEGKTATRKLVIK